MRTMRSPLRELSAEIRFNPLRDAVEAALRATRYQALSRIQVSCHEGLVCLCGHVPCYYAKQLATAAALSISSVLELRNEILVRPLQRQLPDSDFDQP